MGVEIERKFLVRGKAWKSGARGVPYRQGYLASGSGGATVRVRVAGEKAFLTIKGRPVGLARAEYEYEIPTADAEEMLAGLCKGAVVAKTRYKIAGEDVVWEVDEFLGENEGLVVAEVELQSEGQAVEKPAWVGEEVTADSRYSNAALSKRPYSTWETKTRGFGNEGGGD